MRVSVIIPTRDRPEYLVEAVQSVLAQQGCDLELIVVNDGQEPVRLPADPRLRILDNAMRGAVAARNLGVAQAASAAIAFLDDDDVWIDPDHLRRAAGLLTKAPFVFADGIMRFPGETRPRRFAQDADTASLTRDNTILISAVVYLRSLHDTLGLFDDALPYYWDWDWYLRVARAGYALHRIPSTVVDIRIHPHNMSGTGNEQARRNNLDALAAKHGLPPIPLKNHTDFAS